MRRALFAMTAMTMLIGTASCNDPPPVYVDGGYVRLNANPQAPSAAYFTIHGGAEPVVLRGVATDEAVRIELHESVTEGGVVSMRKIDTLDVPARGRVRLAPGGKHIMLWSINPQAIADGRMTFTFTFSNGDRIIADAVVRQPGDDAPADNAADTHDGH